MPAAVLLHQSGRECDFRLGGCLIGCLFGKRVLLPFESAGPIFVLFGIELRLPFAGRLFARGAGVILGVISNAIVMSDIIKYSALKFAGDVFSVDGGSQIRSFESRRERAGEFVSGAS